VLDRACKNLESKRACSFTEYRGYSITIIDEILDIVWVGNFVLYFFALSPMNTIA
jgi:hypothetical protein